MKFCVSILRLIRPVNVLIAVVTAALGAFLVQWQGGADRLLAMMAAVFCATAFGNCINDIHDLAVDTINRPSRVLVRGDLSVRFAYLISTLLGLIALSCGWFISPVFFAAVIVPLILLIVYTCWLKATVLWGNCAVSLMVAYPLLFGALLNHHYVRYLYLPALCAFLLNLVREIVKDVQDQPGDSAHGLKTSALLSSITIKVMVTAISIGYFSVIVLIFRQGFFGNVYLTVSLAGSLPLHIWWLWLVYHKNWQHQCARISMLIKIEMVVGLLSLFIDVLIKRTQ